MQTDHADRRRDLRLRRRLLLVLHAARVRPEYGWLSGRFLYDLIDGAAPGGQRFEGDDHVTALLRDLCAAGHAEERDDRWKTYQPASLDFTSYRITHRGTALVEQHVDPDPLVEDDRVRPVRPKTPNPDCG
jgi:hypothetical protein